MQKWIASGVVGSLAAFFPMIFIIIGFEAIGIDVNSGSTVMLVSLVCGSFGAAYVAIRTHENSSQQKKGQRINL